MQLTYGAKRRLLDLFGTQAHWKNVFNDAFYDENSPRWQSSKQGLMRIMRRKDGDIYEISYNADTEKLSDKQKRMARRVVTGGNAPANANVDLNSQKSFLRVERLANTDVLVSDESGRKFTISSFNTPINFDVDGIARSGVDALGKMRSGHDKAQAIEIPEFGMVAFFEPDGRKILLDEQAGRIYGFDVPTQPLSRSVMHEAEKFNVVDIDTDAAREIGYDLRQDFLDPAKLVLALDAGIEPDIAVLNALDPEKVFQARLDFETPQFDPDWDGPEAWRPRVQKKMAGASTLQKDWSDTVEFEGYYVGIARHFGIRPLPESDQIRFQFVTDAREKLLAQGRGLQMVDEAGYQKPTRFVGARDLRATLFDLHHSGHGYDTRDQGTRWKVLGLEHDEAAKYTKRMRESVSDMFGPDVARHSFACISLGENQSMVSMNADVLGRAVQVMQVSSAVVAMAENGSVDRAALRALMEQGADLRYVDPEAAGKGKGFAGLFSEKGNSAMAAEIWNMQPNGDFAMPELAQ